MSTTPANADRRQDHPLAVEYVPLDAIRPHPHNARQGDLGAIGESIRVNGVYRPVIVQRSTGHILAGNHTAKAMAQAGRAEAPVVYLDVDDAEALRILLADNRTADLGDYDGAALVDLLRTLPDLEGTGYDGDDLDDLLDDLEPLTPDDTEDPEPAAPRLCQACGYNTTDNPDGLASWDPSIHPNR